MTPLVITIVAILVLGPIITLLWWRIADQWADAERRRFRPDRPPPPPAGRVVIRGFPRPGQTPRGSEAPRDA